MEPLMKGSLCFLGLLEQTPPESHPDHTLEYLPAECRSGWNPQRCVPDVKVTNLSLYPHLLTEATNHQHASHTAEPSRHAYRGSWLPQPTFGFVVVFQSSSWPWVARRISPKLQDKDVFFSCKPPPALVVLTFKILNVGLTRAGMTGA